MSAFEDSSATQMLILATLQMCHSQAIYSRAL
jgi:hypothetical protein